MSMTNAFGNPVPSRAVGLSSDNTRAYIRLVLSQLLGAVAVPETIRESVTERILSAAREEEDFVYERDVHDILQIAVPRRQLARALAERATHLFAQISKFLRPGTALDLGCGDARLSRLVQAVAARTVLADVYCHDEALSSGLPFVLLTQDGPIPLESDAFDNVLLCTVLHHAEHPLETLREAARVTRPGGRLLIHESVYGVETRSDFVAADDVTKAFLALDAQGQFAVNSFFDQLYNRCFFYSPDPSQKVAVPYNFLPPSRWIDVLRDAGLSVERVDHLGVDLPVAPLFHTLFVARKM